MCGLFGFVDYGHILSRKARHRLLYVLSTACEERGTDATGIAYHVAGKQVIYKRPIPAHLMWYRVPADAAIVMGHTRMATQGSALRLENDHPFGAGNKKFALAHNGVLYNEKILRQKHQLPSTSIETDSYVAVQLLEKYDKADFNSLRFMAEELEGTFTITVVTEDALYFVKGNNPMCIYHYPDAGLYVYASTEDILRKAMLQAKLKLGKVEKIQLFSGELLQIDERGKMARSFFDDSKLYETFLPPWTHWGGYEPVKRPYAEDSWLDDLKSVAKCFGCFPEDVDALIEEGMTPEEIEDFFYCG